FVYVTHDQAEALALADRLVIVNQGRIVEAGSPRALYDRPGSRFVGEFLGSPPMNFLECRVIRESNGADWLWSAGPRPGKLAIPSSFVERLPAGPVLLGVRPEHVVLAESESPREPDHVCFQNGADLSGLVYLGHETVASLSLGSGWRARLPGGTRLTRKTPMAVGFHLDHARWFEFESGRAIPLDALADPANRG
ncbi:MAG: TOBE domain-containing protein, partial [Isosphaeraceae bacterium]